MRINPVNTRIYPGHHISKSKVQQQPSSKTTNTSHINMPAYYYPVNFKGVPM